MTQPEKLASSQEQQETEAAWDNYHASRELVEKLTTRLEIGYWKTKKLEQQNASFLLPDATLATELVKYETFFVKLLGDYCKACDENLRLWRNLLPVINDKIRASYEKKLTTWYECGYSNLGTAKELIAKVKTLGAILVDIRLNPYSKRAEYQKAWLASECKKQGVGYLHIPELGNINYNKDGEPIQIKDLPAGLRELKRLMATDNIMLMCGCKNLETCHRKTVIEALPQDRKGE